jgi:hypothetical protein
VPIIAREVAGHSMTRSARRERVLHPGRVERRAPAALVVSCRS